MKRLIAVAVAALLMTAVGLFFAVEAGITLGGISRGQATALAVNHAETESSTAPRVLWAVPGIFGLFRGGATDEVSPWSRWVWAVRLAGTFLGSCPPTGITNGQGPLRCSTDQMETVILDYRTGAFIMASIEP
jgi:hypothetical protein